MYRSELYPDRNDRNIIAVATQDCTPILEENKVLRSEKQTSDWGREVFSVPNVIAYQWLIEEWNKGNKGLKMFSREWMELVKRKMYDPDWKWLRTDK